MAQVAAPRLVSAADARRDWARAFEPLWVFGLAALCLLVGRLVFRGPWLDLQGKTYDWAQYAVAGALFPTLLLGAPLLWRWRGWPTAPFGGLRPALAIGALAAFAVLLAANAVRYGPGVLVVAVALAAAQTALVARPWRPGRREPGRLALAFVVAVVAWTVVWSFRPDAFAQPPTFLAGFAAAFLLVCVAGRAPDPAAPDLVIAAGESPDEPRLPLRRHLDAADFVGLVVIALMSLRTDGLFTVFGERGALHHMGAWVGAADLMRQGAWLLWDAPSNYGYLNVLAFAFIPTATPWQAFYLVQALAFFVVGGGTFLLLRTLRSGWLNWAFALAAAIAIPMYSQMTDPAGPLVSTFIFPNWGAYRYVVCFALLAILVWEYVADERSPRHRRILVLGCLAWVAGVLWSPESAFFCSGTWLPAYGAIVLRMTADGPRRWRRAFAWLALPPALLAAVLALLAAVYAVAIGHLPDPLAFLDYAQEVGLNVLIVVNEPVGRVMGLVLGFCALAVGAAYAGTRAGLPTRSFGLWIGLLGAFWATNSYGYQRGVVSLHPVSLAALGVLLALIASTPRAGAWAAAARGAALPLLVLPLALPFAEAIANPLAAREAAASLADTARHRFAIEYLLPDADPELQQVMAEAGVTADDPIFYAGDWLGNPLLPWRPGGATDGPRLVAAGPQWTPGHPSLALRWIPPGRGAVYTERYIGRHPQSGWLIQNKHGEGSTVDFNGYAGGLEPWMFDLLRDTHVPTRVYEDADWQLVWFEYVGDRTDIPRPDYAWDRLGPLPPDVAVDGKPLSGTAHPEVWAVFGKGWGLFDPELGGRGASGQTTLWVYSPDRRDALVRVTPSSVAGPSRLTIERAGDGAAHRPEPLSPDKPTQSVVSLEPGWNPLTFTLKAGAPRGTKRANGDAAQEPGGDAPTAATAAAGFDAEAPTGFVLERIEIVSRAIS